MALLALAFGGVVQAQDSSGGEDVQSEFAGDPRFPAPDFPADLEWINVPGPVSLQDLRGKVVILDFWTYC